MSFSCHSVFVRHLLLIKLRYVALVYVCAPAVDCIFLAAINRDIALNISNAGCRFVALHIGFEPQNFSVVILRSRSEQIFTSSLIFACGVTLLMTHLYLCWRNKNVLISEFNAWLKIILLIRIQHKMNQVSLFNKMSRKLILSTEKYSQLTELYILHLRNAI